MVMVAREKKQRRGVRFAGGRGGNLKYGGRWVKQIASESRLEGGKEVTHGSTGGIELLARAQRCWKCSRTKKATVAGQA